MAISSRKDFVCGFCLNTGARPLRNGLDKVADRYRFIWRWTRCQACAVNICDKRSGPEIVDSLRATKVEQILNSPSNR